MRGFIVQVVHASLVLTPKVFIQCHSQVTPEPVASAYALAEVLHRQRTTS